MVSLLLLALMKVSQLLLAFLLLLTFLLLLALMMMVSQLYHRERILETSTLSCNEEKEEITKPPKR